MGRTVRDNTRNLVLAGLFAALMAVAGRINIPLPLPGAMVISPQTMMAALSGIVLGAKWGAISQGVYVLLGLAGLPIFTMGGGLGYLLQPSGGFALAFPLIAAVAGLIAGQQPSGLRCALAAAVGILSGYMVGVPYMAVILNVYLSKGLSPWTIAQIGFLVYLPGEAVKVAVAAVVAPPIRRAVGR